MELIKGSRIGFISAMNIIIRILRLSLILEAMADPKADSKALNHIHLPYPPFLYPFIHFFLALIRARLYNAKNIKRALENSQPTSPQTKDIESKERRLSMEFSIELSCNVQDAEVRDLIKARAMLRMTDLSITRELAHRVKLFYGPLEQAIEMGLVKPAFPCKE